MAIPTRSSRLFWIGSAVLAFAFGSALRAADAPRQEVTGRLDTAALTRLIDQAVQERLAEEKAPSAPLADDAEFVRRAYLDLTGVIPPADKVTAFLDSKQPGKRARLIDELL